MGQLVHFYAGDPEVIGRAFASQDFGTLKDRSKIPLSADFSLHLSPIDYELLSEAIQSIVGSGPSSLEESLQTQVAGSSDERSADIVSPEWVRMVAAVRDEQTESVLSAWIEATAEEHGESPSEPTDDARLALRELIGLCRESLARGLPVVHTWSL